MIKYGVDVSVHNGTIDWNQVKHSGKVDFVILRAGYGKDISQKDKRFEEYYQQCSTLAIPVGAYWYSYAMTPEEAKQEAEVFLQVLKGKQFAYPVYFDLEEQKQLALGKNACSAITEAFLSTVENSGYFVGLYMSKSYLENCISETIRKNYSIWVAQYGVEKTNYSGQFGMWQKSSSGSVSGIPEQVDLDECYSDYPEIIRKAQLNGFSSSEEKEKKFFSLTFDGKTYSGILTEN